MDSSRVATVLVRARWTVAPRARDASPNTEGQETAQLTPFSTVSSGNKKGLLYAQRENVGSRTRGRRARGGLVVRVGRVKEAVFDGHAVE